MVMSQSDFVQKVLTKFFMDEAYPRKLPCDVHKNQLDFEDLHI